MSRSFSKGACTSKRRGAITRSVGSQEDPNEQGERQERLRKRLVAARGLADLTQPQLGAKTPWGKTTISEMETGKRAILDHEVPPLAAACNVSPAFFYVDFMELDEPSLRADVTRLRADLEELSLGVARRFGELRALVGLSPPEAPTGDVPQ